MHSAFVALTLEGKLNVKVGDVLQGTLRLRKLARPYAEHGDPSGNLYLYAPHRFSPCRPTDVSAAERKRATTKETAMATATDRIIKGVSDADRLTADGAQAMRVLRSHPENTKFADDIERTTVALEKVYVLAQGSMSGSEFDAIPNEMHVANYFRRVSAAASSSAHSALPAFQADLPGDVLGKSAHGTLMDDVSNETELVEKFKELMIQALAGDKNAQSILVANAPFIESRRAAARRMEAAALISVPIPCLSPSPPSLPSSVR